LALRRRVGELWASALRRGGRALAITADAQAAKLPKRAFDWLEESGYANNLT
jgi:hypothetical protein